ncbi:hypothetical protein DERP_005676, partial [Dermatophagoides pteronyssinus]
NFYESKSHYSCNWTPSSSSSSSHIIKKFTFTEPNNICEEKKTIINITIFMRNIIVGDRYISQLHCHLIYEINKSKLLLFFSKYYFIVVEINDDHHIQVRMLTPRSESDIRLML